MLLRKKFQVASVFIFFAALQTASIAHGDIPPTTFQLNSGAFMQGQPIPERFTAEGQNEAPALNWYGQPSSTREYTLVVRDAETSTVQWLVYGITGSSNSILEAIRSGAYQGVNSTGKATWSGPLPAVGSGPHHYIFQLYAIDTILSMGDGVTRTIGGGATPAEVMKAMQGHIVGVATLTGTYERHGS